MLILANFRVVYFAGCDAGTGVLSGGVLVAAVAAFAPVFLEDLRAGAILPGDELALVWMCRGFVCSEAEQWRRSK